MKKIFKIVNALNENKNVEKVTIVIDVDKFTLCIRTNVEVWNKYLYITYDSLTGNWSFDGECDIDFITTCLDIVKELEVE